MLYEKKDKEITEQELEQISSMEGSPELRGFLNAFTILSCKSFIGEHP